MATRTSLEDVKAIIKFPANDDDGANACIQSANVLVTSKLAAEYDDALLIEIEKWLAAHFIAIKYPRVANKTAGPNSKQYHGQTGMKGLEHTPYGTQVMMLEYKGILTRAVNGKGPIMMENLP